MLVLVSIVLVGVSHEVNNSFERNCSFIFFFLFFFFRLPVDFCGLNGEVCNQLTRGIHALIGAVSADSFRTIHSYTNTFHMPFFSPWFPEKVTSHSASIAYVSIFQSESFQIEVYRNQVGN